MGQIYYLMGKSATGKDTIYGRLMADPDLDLSPVTLYTSRPKRAGEQEGREYYFVSLEEAEAMEKTDRCVESRCYQTVHGPWYYLTMEDGQIKEEGRYLMMGTLESYTKIRAFYGPDRVIPLYLVISDEERLMRAIKREKMQALPSYKEVCRRYLADEVDFSPENLNKAGISCGIDNTDLDRCLHRIKAIIKEGEKKS